MYKPINAYSGQNQPVKFDEIFLPFKSLIGKLFEGEMLFRTLPISLLQIFSKIILNSKDSAKGILDPDDNFWGKRLSINGLKIFGLGFAGIHLVHSFLGDPC